MTPLELAEAAIACEALDARVRRLLDDAVVRLHTALLPDSRGHEPIVRCERWRVVGGRVEMYVVTDGWQGWCSSEYDERLVRRPDDGVALLFGKATPMHGSGRVPTVTVLLLSREVTDV